MGFASTGRVQVNLVMKIRDQVSKPSTYFSRNVSRDTLELYQLSALRLQHLTEPGIKAHPSPPRRKSFAFRLRYSDDELTDLNPIAQKQKCCWSKDDAWVNIPVASRARRANNQDA